MDAGPQAGRAPLSAARLLAPALLLLALWPCTAHALDGDRRGFFLGFGAGPGFGGGGLWGLETDFKIGTGLSDRTVLHYSGRQLWVRSEGVFVTAAYPSIAFTAFDHPRAPSGYFTAGAGVGVVAAAFRGRTGAALLGPSAFIGFGHEFRRHAAIELQLGGSVPMAGVLVTNASLTLHVLGY